MRVLLVASSGGHLTQLWWMRPWWSGHERVWVSFDEPHARRLLAHERLIVAHHPTNRHLPNLARNLALARRILKVERPDLVVSTGAGVGVPFLWLGGRYGARTVFVEVFDRTDAPSLTGRLVAPVVDAIVLQRGSQRAIYPRGIVLGPVR
ncbi:MAG TPA: UDP-N-acetylglucosamine--LPS N-acetylglucosamine transferase [Deltaproteobacteria bacterium]|nr:UDP-N-acetylglucosamine--LPS N-acetylglucosamine transferase [Deltaproteobacteria bacterium]